MHHSSTVWTWVLPSGKHSQLLLSLLNDSKPLKGTSERFWNDSKPLEKKSLPEWNIKYILFYLRESGKSSSKSKYLDFSRFIQHRQTDHVCDAFQQTKWLYCQPLQLFIILTSMIFCRHKADPAISTMVLWSIVPVPGIHRFSFCTPSNTHLSWKGQRHDNPFCRAFQSALK